MATLRDYLDASLKHRLTDTDLAAALRVAITATDMTVSGTFTINSDAANPLSLNGTVNGAYSVVLTNLSNGTANQARYVLISGDGAATLRAAGTGLTAALLTGGPTGRQVVLTSAGAYPLLFGVANAYVGGFDDNATARNTRFLIYDVDNGQVERVSVGVADSGGAGFKLLRIPN